MKRLICGVAAGLLSLSLFAQHTLHDLDIQVQLEPNGDAWIQETRQMTIGPRGTECYIVISNLNGSDIGDLSVSDETGKEYLNIGAWDVNSSRSEKAGKCGLVTKSNGYEVCWGIGDDGERTYITTYKVTNLLKSYGTSDGFNWMFVTRNIQPSPQHVTLTMWAADGTEINDSVANIWGFGFKGSVWFDEGCIHAESSEPFESDYCMIIMAEFTDSLFQPSMSAGEPFESLKERALEGSDYGMDFDEGSESDDDWFDMILGGLMMIGMGFFGLVGLLYAPVTYIVRWWKYKRNLEWYRDIPFNGNLTTANNVLNKLRLGTDYDKLLSACVIKLVNLGALGIENHPNREGKVVPAFVVKEWDGKNQPSLLRKIHNIFKQAAGEDTVLEPWELKAYMKDKSNQSEMDSFLNVLHGINIFSLSKQKDEVRNLMGLKKFLEEFTLMSERGIQEGKLWKDYMVYATLFGNAKRVIAEMKKINPEYFKMDNIANQMAEGMTVPTIYTVFHRGTADAYSAKMLREHPSSSRGGGGGGFSSFGGGGGFSGGGSGGGIR